MADVDLADLAALPAAARQRSFRGAAALRGTSASGLSEAVRRLEARLGVRLLNRTTRSVTPTEAGAGLLERLGPPLGEGAAALEAGDKHRGGVAGTFRLHVPSGGARLLLPPLGPGVLTAHPGVALEVAAGGRFLHRLA